jgi:hypothetical protein
LVPPSDQEASGIITGSEEILKAYSSKHSLNARVINDLINDVLKNPAFNADEVDHEILKRLQASIDSCDIQIINMNVEGDGRKCVLPDILPDIIPDIIYRYHTRYPT